MMMTRSRNPKTVTRNRGRGLCAALLLTLCLAACLPR